MTGHERLLPSIPIDADNRHESSRPQLDECFTVRVQNSSAVARIDTNGSFECSPLDDDDSEGRNPLDCCGCGDLQPFQINGSDIVGAKITRGASFVILYCPGHTKNGHFIRKLSYSKSVTCENIEAAEKAVHLIRKQNAWWGRNQPPHLTVFVNPISGSGKAKVAWKEKACPILEAAGFKLDVTETQSQNHAFGMVKRLQPRSTDALLCVAGDGTMSEIVQALLNRDDCHEARELPLCLIPGGTGNGMSASQGLWNPETAAHAISKGKLKRMDILSVLQPPNKRLFSFLSITFGFIANVDIDTEYLRFLGTLRNQVGAVDEILRSRAYHANVAVFEAPSSKEKQQFWSAEQTQFQTKETDSNHGPSLLGAFNDLQKLPSLDSAPLPDGWRLLDRRAFSVFVVSVMPWLALDFSIAPTEQVDSGEMTLTHMPGHMPRLQALKSMTLIEAQKTSSVPDLVEEKIVAFVLEPTKDGTHIVMDGELLPYKRIFCVLQPGLCVGFTAP